MSFDKLQAQLNAARERHEQSVLNVAAANEKLSRTKRERERAARQQSKEVSRLNRKLDLLQRVVKKWTDVRDRARIEAKDKLKDFEPFTDPREMLSNLDDRTPILLFPV